MSLRVAVTVEGQEDVSWADWVALAETAEGAGLEALFRSDHYASLAGFSERGALDAWGTICGLAAITDKLRLGTLVSPASFRHPSVLAKLVTTADHISGGRVELGLGTGWSEDEHHSYGFPMLPLGKRIDVLAEQLEIIWRTWADEAFDFDGETYQLRGLAARPRPIQDPHPPLILGGSGGPRSAGLAARWADEYNFDYATLDQCRERRGRLRAACEAEGRDPGSLRISLATACLVGSTRSEVRRRARQALAHMGSDAGATDAATDAYLAERQQEGWIVGTLEEVSEQLQAVADCGVDRVMLQLFFADLEAVQMIGVLASEMGTPQLAGAEAGEVAEAGRVS